MNLEYHGFVLLQPESWLVKSKMWKKKVFVFVFGESKL